MKCRRYEIKISHQQYLATIFVPSTTPLLDPTIWDRTYSVEWVCQKRNGTGNEKFNGS